MQLSRPQCASDEALITFRYFLTTPLKRLQIQPLSGWPTLVQVSQYYLKPSLTIYLGSSFFTTDLVARATTNLRLG